MDDGDKLGTVGDIINYSELEDWQLIKQSSDGDEYAFEFLRERYLTRVFGICLRMTGNKDIAEDLTQEVFFKIWQKSDSFRGESVFLTWLYRLTVRHIFDYYRKNKRRIRAEYSVNEGEQENLNNPETLDNTDIRIRNVYNSPRINLLRGTPESILENKESISFFRLFVEWQNATDKEILEHRIFGGLNPLEIAEIIDNPEWEHLSDAEKAKRISNRIRSLLRRFAEILKNNPYIFKEEILRKFQTFLDQQNPPDFI